ncbi:hypothetical protein [Streptomyces sp. NPDC048191]|uniref:hypothetical protein n=1 Tax=Streptomyces sp. NPDC048191 TaxID=3155484 RepID=UPI003400BE4A
MKDKDRMQDTGHSDDATAAERAARRQREAERERASAQPFDYPYPERRPGVRARRRVSEAQAAADMPPGIPGGYGTTGGGATGATGGTPRDETRSRGTGSPEPGGDDERPVERRDT